MVTEFYHASRASEEIDDFHLLSHFGTLKAALDRCASRVMDNVDDPYIYKVLIDVENPLMISDLFETNHSWLKLTDYLYYKKKVLSADERGLVFDAAAPSGTNTDPANKALCQILLDRGYDAITYKNMHEDRGSLSVITLDTTSIHVLDYVRSSDIEGMAWPTQLSLHSKLII